MALISVLICSYHFNYSSLAEVIARVTLLSPLKGKSTRYHFDTDLMTQTGVNRTVCFGERRYPLFNEMNNDQTHGVLIKRPRVDKNDDIIITDFGKPQK